MLKRRSQPMTVERLLSQVRDLTEREANDPQGRYANARSQELHRLHQKYGDHVDAIALRVGKRFLQLAEEEQIFSDPRVNAIWREVAAIELREHKS